MVYRRQMLLSIIFMVLAGLGFSIPAHATYSLPATISADMTLGLTSPAADGIYLVPATVTVTSGATLTCQAGIQVRFAAATGMVFGSTTVVGKLVCNGTSTQPVLFTADTATPTRGFWGNIYFYDYSDGSSLTYTTIEYGGSSSALVYGNNANVTFTNCTVRYSATTGIYFLGDSAVTVTNTLVNDNTTYGFRASGTSSPSCTNLTTQNNTSYGVYLNSTGYPSFSNCTITNNTTYGMYCSANTVNVSVTTCSFTNNAGVPLRLGANRITNTSGNTFTGNSSNYIEVLSATVALDSTWRLQGIPYRITGEVYIRGNDGADNVTTVTIQPGTTVEVNGSYGITVGDDTSLPGGLLAQGTAVNPIIFTKGAANWYGIYFSKFSNASLCILDYCRFYYGSVSTSRPAIYCYYSSPTITNCIVDHSVTYGIYLNNSSAPISNCEISFSTNYGIYSVTSNSVITSCNFHDNSVQSIYASSTASNLTITGSTFTNNTGAPIRIGANRVPFVTNNTFSGNVANYIEVIATTVAQDGTWKAQGIPYRLLGEVYIRGTDGIDVVTTVTIEANNTIEVNGAFGITVGSDTDQNLPGGLLVTGTSTNPVTFTGVSGATWAGIYFSTYSSDSLCNLNYCRLYNGGNPRQSIYCNYANPTIQNTLVTNGLLDGIYCNYSAPTLSYCEVAYSATNGITCNESNPVISYGYIHHNTNYGIHCLGVAGDPQILNTNVTSNTSTGIYCETADNGPTITACTISSNLYPIRIYARHCQRITSSLISGNTNPDIKVEAETITADASWEGQTVGYSLSGTLTVQGRDGADNVTTLTLLAGAKLMFPTRSRLYIGHDTDPTYTGAVKALGTSLKPVILTTTSTTPAAGSWMDVYIAPLADDTLCEFNYMKVLYAGQYDTVPTPAVQYYPVTINSANPKFYDCTISFSPAHCVYATNSTPMFVRTQITDSAYNNLYYLNCGGVITDCTFSNAAGTYSAVKLDGTSSPAITGGVVALAGGYGIECTNINAAPIINDNLFISNANYPIYIYARNVKNINTPLNTYLLNNPDQIYVVGETLTLDNYWYDQHIPYRISTSVTVQGTDGANAVTTLTLEPGATLYMDASVYLYIGSTTVGTPGGLLAQGTSSKHITFRDVNPTPVPGSWNRIYFYNYADDSLCKMDYCDVIGASYGVYANLANPQITNCLFSYNSSYGIYATGAACAPVIQNCEVRYSTSYGIGALAASTPSISNCNIHHNTTYGINVSGSSLPSITNSTFEYNGYGIYCAAAADVPTVTGCAFNYNTNYPIRIYARNVRNLTSNTYSNNTNQFINVVADTISLDSIWQNSVPYYCTSTVYVQGQDGADTTTTLTLQPGCTLKFATGYLYIGHDSTVTLPGALIANGTSVLPITISGYTQTPGSWSGVYFANLSIDATCVMNYCNVSYAVRNLICNQSTPATITNCTFSYGNSLNGASAYMATPSNPTFTSCSFLNATGLNVGFSGTVNATFNSCTFNTASDSNISIPAVSTVVFNSCNFSNATVNNVLVSAAATTNFTNCSFASATGSNISYTSTAVATFDQCSFGPSTAIGLQIAGGANVTVTQGNIHHHGGNGINVSGTSTLTMTNSTINANAGGLVCASNAETATVTGCAFTNNSDYPVRMYASKVRLVTNCTFTGNTNQLFFVNGDIIIADSTWQNHGIPYFMDTGANLTVQGMDGADSVTTLTINPGCSLLFKGAYLWVGSDTDPALPGALIANGTSGSIITFTSGNAVKVAGDWMGLYFGIYATPSVSSLKFCTISYGGSTSTYENIQANVSLTVEDSEIAYGEGYGVRAIGAAADITMNNCYIHHSTLYGVYAGAGTVQMNNCRVTDNGTRGIYINESVAGAPSTLVANSIISNNGSVTTSGYGIYITAASSTPLIRNCMISNNNGSTSGTGIYITSSALPIIGGNPSNSNYFAGHLTYGVNNVTTTTCINAQYNYWGMSGGPLDISYAIDYCMNTGNPNVGAEKVTERVDYSNWTNTAATATPSPSPTISPTPTYTATPTRTPTRTATPVLTPTPIPCLNTGDVNDDGMLSAGDAQMVYIIVLGMYTPTAEEACAADCDGNTSVTIADAQCIFIHGLGGACDCADPLLRSFRVNELESESELLESTNEVTLEAGPYPTPIWDLLKADSSLLQNEHQVSEFLSEETDANVITISNVHGAQDDIIEVAIDMNNLSNAVDAISCTFNYPADMLEYLGHSLDNYRDIWVMFNTNETAPGQIRIAGFSYPGFIPADTSASVIVLKFRVTCFDCSNTDVGTLSISNMNDDLTGWRSLAGSFTYTDKATETELSPDYYDLNTLTE